MTGGGYVRAFGFRSTPCQQLHQLTHALLELLLRVWMVWHLCLEFPWISIKTQTRAAARLMVLFRVVGLIVPSLHQLLPPELAGQLGSARIISALAVLQQKASDDTSLGIDRKPNGKPADVWLVSQHPTQPFLTASDYISVMLLTLCCLLITTRRTSMFNLDFFACNNKMSLLLPAISSSGFFFFYKRRV